MAIPLQVRLFWAASQRMSGAPVPGLGRRHPDVLVSTKQLDGADGAPLSARVYRPSGTVGTALPVIVHFPDGGFTSVRGPSPEWWCSSIAHGAGAVVVSVQYRTAPEHPFPTPLEDCYAAVLWVGRRADDLGADGSRLAVMGDGAGGNLAAAVCLLARDSGGPAIALQLLAYPATEYAVERPSWLEHAKAPLLSTDDVVWFWGQYLPDAGDRTDPRATPSSATTLAGLPPAFVLTAEYDPLRDDGEAYAARLADDGVKVTHTRYPGVFHGFFSMVGVIARTDTAIQDAAAQLSAHLAR